MVQAVIGLGFGDEGKGKVTDYLCSQSLNPLVIRYSGGHQAGHTVVRDGKRHVFSNFGSGTLSGVHTYWSPFCTIEPIGLIRELNQLLGIGIKPILFIDSKCPVTTPYDIFSNKLKDQHEKHGTCGVGFGETINREEHLYSLLAEDLQFSSVLRLKLNLISSYYKKYHIDLSEFNESIEELLNSSHIKIVNQPPDHNNIIFEGSQGLLLDQQIGFFPHVTRSNTGTRNILTFNYKPNLFLVTRAYQTRHGNGPMTNENLPHNITIDENETNQDNKYQGVFRRSLLDLDLLLYGINKDKYIQLQQNKVNAVLVITCLDHIKNEYRFTYNREIVYCTNENDFITKISNLLSIKHVLISKSPDSSDMEQFHLPIY